MKQSFLFLTSCLCLTALQATPPSVPTHMPVELVNSSGLTDDRIYVLIKGTHPVGLTGMQCYIDLSDPSSIGTYADATTQTMADTYSYPLSSLTGTEGARLFYVPRPLESSRIYFAVDYPLFMAVKRDAATCLETIADPSGFNTNDPNYYKLFDKLEFTYNPAATAGIANLYMNPTAVDFFALPIQIHMVNSITPLGTSGIPLARQTVIGNVQDTFDAYDGTPEGSWGRLILPFPANPQGQNLTATLRISSPGPACAPGSTSPAANPNQAFPASYLEDLNTFGFDYVKNVWDFYAIPGNELRIDALEIRANGFSPGSPTAFYYFVGSVTGGTSVYPSPAGQVVGASGFLFVNYTDDCSFMIAKPEPGYSTYPFFAGANFIDQGSYAGGSSGGAGAAEVNNTPGAIIIRQLTSGFDVGVLPVDFATGTFLDFDYFRDVKTHLTGPDGSTAGYYSNNPFWGPEAITNGPFYDLYSKALHDLDYPIYTFAYDDELGQDGTLQGNVEANGSYPIITLHTIDGVIPDFNAPGSPGVNQLSFTVTFQPGLGVTLYYENGTNLPFTPHPTTKTTPDIHSPFIIQSNAQVDLDGNKELELIEVNLLYNTFTPYVPHVDVSSGCNAICKANQVCSLVTGSTVGTQPCGN